MPVFPYNRGAAVEYARRWALSRNPRYYDFEKLGGDCTNFVSQCLYSGSGVMNYKPTFGWYYASAGNRSPSWTGVVYLYNFLTRKTGTGPMGKEVSIYEAQPGDVSQFAEEEEFSHSQMIVSAGNPPSAENILVCAHSDDSFERALSTYEFEKIRFIHITGVVK